MYYMELDLTLLRSFVAAAERGSFTAASNEMGLAQPTISLQMKRLEEQLGIALFAPSGRGKQLTEIGARFLVQARRLLQINDMAIRECAHATFSGHLRIGTTQDFAEDRLLLLLRTFNEAHPDVQLDLTVDLNRNIHHAFERERLDIAIAAQDPDAPLTGELLYSEPLIWIAAEGVEPSEPLPLVLFHEPCIVRDQTLRTLAQQDRSWRLVCESPSLSGLLAATRAGLGITVRTRAQIGPGLAEIDGDCAMPLLPSLEITLFQRLRPGTDPALHRRMIGLIRDELFASHSVAATTV